MKEEEEEGSTHPSFNKRVMKHMLKCPTLSPKGMEWSVHSCPKSLESDIGLVFNRKRVTERPVLIIATCQNSSVELVNWGDKEAYEKDRLLETFVSCASEICKKIREKSYWANYCDPASGLPILDDNVNIIYPEVESMEILLNYKTNPTGGCKILYHPRWGAAVYPASIFTDCPLEVSLEIFESVF